MLNYILHFTNISCFGALHCPSLFLCDIEEGSQVLVLAGQL